MIETIVGSTFLLRGPNSYGRVHFPELNDKLTGPAGCHAPPCGVEPSADEDERPTKGPHFVHSVCPILPTTTPHLTTNDRRILRYRQHDSSKFGCQERLGSRLIYVVLARTHVHRKRGILIHVENIGGLFHFFHLSSGKRNLLRHTTDYYRALRSTL
jgi:hypothetical protein